MIPGADEELDFFIVFIIPEDIVSKPGKAPMASKSLESDIGVVDGRSRSERVRIMQRV